MTDVPKFYTTAEVADIFRVKAETVRDWIKDGKMSAKKIEGRLLVPHSEIVKFADVRMEN